MLYATFDQDQSECELDQYQNLVVETSETPKELLYLTLVGEPFSMKQLFDREAPYHRDALQFMNIYLGHCLQE